MNQNPSFLKEQDLRSPEGDSPASEQQGIPSPSQSPGNQEPKASFSVKKEVISWLLHFAGAFVLVFIIQAFLFVPVRSWLRVPMAIRPIEYFSTLGFSANC